MNTSHTASPGVRVTRRTALHGTWSLPALWALSRLGQGREDTAEEVGSFLEAWAKETKAFAAGSKPNEDAYLHRLCADLAGLDPTAFPERMQVAFQKDGVTSGPISAEMPFLVLQFDLEPHAIIRAHNHVGWSFLSMGVKGEATVKHFELFGSAPEPGEERDVDFKIREVSSCLLERGRTSSLTRTRANIHWFQAGAEGARFIDFGIQFPDPGEGFRSFSVLDFDAQPVDHERRIHKARWLGNIYAKK